MEPLAAAVLALVLWLLAILAYYLVSAVRAFLLPFFFPIDLINQYGAWAAVTGCTDGIGLAYTKELARRHLNIVLISRNPDKLASVARMIEREYNVQTKIVIADFSKGQAVFSKIKTELNGIPIGILVNNVGKQYTYPTYLGEVNEQELWDIININVGATTMMTRMIINEMAARKRGAIVNISSSSELQPLPLMTVYAATKCYMKNFSRALRFEYGRHGITIQHVSPFYVSTKMNAFSHRFEQSSLMVPTAERYAFYAVNTLGRIENTTGYWSHGIQHFVTTIPPKWLRMYIGGYMNEVLRKDYLNKSDKDVITVR